MISEFDVVISGAGPAGCTAALALGSSGLKVALIEKEKFPREKVCGDAIPAFVPKVLYTINPDYTIAFEGLKEKNRINICRIVSPKGKSLDLKFPEDGFTCKRQIFDAFLFELTRNLPNVTILQENPVRDVTLNGNGVIISTDKNINLKARLVIGCDGAASITRKKLIGTGTGSENGSVAVRAYFKNVKDVQPGTIEFHFLKNLLPGYFWIFPLPQNQVNIGLGIPSKTTSDKKINLRNEFNNIIKTDPYLSPRFLWAEMTGEIKGHFLPLCTYQIPISGDHFMLCGDAASLVNPATGGGIGQAMQSGRYAGWQALKCFEKNDFSAGFISSYDKTVHDKIGRENKHYRLIRDHIFNYPWRLNAAINLGSRSNFMYKTILKALK
jgi:geranylgeranyl reductase family protein